jgi:hypothetical protein
MEEAKAVGKDAHPACASFPAHVSCALGLLLFARWADMDGLRTKTTLQSPPPLVSPVLWLLLGLLLLLHLLIFLLLL